MSNVYVDLNDHLARKTSILITQKIFSLRISVQFTDGFRNTRPTGNPNGLKADEKKEKEKEKEEEDIFYCFKYVTVIVFVECAL